MTSHATLFSFTTGLLGPLTVPKGTKTEIMDHVLTVEKELGLKRTQYLDNPVHWEHTDQFDESIKNDKLCEVVEDHNQWVRMIYAGFEMWLDKPLADGETITHDDAKEFWHGLSTLTVPFRRWSPEYYIARMDTAYEVMRGRPAEGVNWGRIKSLSPPQAAAVIWLFSTWFDVGDRRLDVPKGRDYLASSYDGGYDWCEKCGAVTPEDGEACSRRKCPLRLEREALG